MFEIDRESRTVFAYNLNLRAEERDLFTFFSRAGPLVDIRMIRDRNTGRSKGFAYIEFEKRESVIAALQLSGQSLGGQPVMVKSSEAEKNVAWQLAEQQKKAAKSEAGASSIVAVSNIHPSLTETDIKPIFEPFGALQSVQLQRDPSGRSLGTGMIVFQESDEALKAAQNLQNLDILGLQLQLRLVPVDEAHSNGMPPATTNLPERLDADADDGGGMKLTAQGRAALMSRLAAGAGMEIPSALQNVLGNAPKAHGGVHGGVPESLVLEQGVLGPASPIPTPCLLLKNMFDSAEETEPHWEEEIAADVRSECQKYGDVAFVYVDPMSKGFVYLKFGTVQAASAAQKALNGRWFAGKQIAADFQFLPIFNNYFKLT